MELDVLRYANKVSSAAHIAVMKAIRPGECWLYGVNQVFVLIHFLLLGMKEYQGEAVFLHHAYF